MVELGVWWNGVYNGMGHKVEQGIWWNEAYG